MKTLLRGSCLSSLVFVLACGGGATPGPKAVGDTDKGPAVAGDDSGADLTPVSAPADLVLVGRIAKPGGMIDLFQSWAKLPVDWRRLLAAKEPEMAQVIDFDAPVEAAVALDPAASGDFPQPFAVVSVGLRSLQGTLEFARRMGDPVRQLGPGVYRVGSGSVSCVAAASVGASPARLVCGDRAEDVDALAPYATRGLPTENLGSSDVRIELRIEPVRRRYSSELRQGKSLATPFVLRRLSLDDPRVDRPLADAVHGLTDELLALVEDVDRLVIDAKADQRGYLDTSFTLGFRGSSSWLVGTMLDSASRSAPAPDAFWRLPVDATSASYSVGGDPKRGESLRRTLAELADGLLAHATAPKRVRDDLVSVLNESWASESYVYAGGPVADAPMPGDAAGRKRELTRRGIGWHLAIAAEPIKKHKGILDKLVRAYNDAQVRKLALKSFGLEAKDIPRLVARGSRGLPGASTYEVTLPGEMFAEWDPDKDVRIPGKPLSVFLVLSGDATQTYVAVAPDEKTAIEKITTSMKGDSKKTLASREGLGPLKQDRAISQGFFNILTFVGSAKSALAERAGSDAASRVDVMVNSMPHRGTTPILTAFTAKAGSKPELSWRIRAPREVFEDLGAMGTAAAGMGGGGSAPVRPPQP